MAVPKYEISARYQPKDGDCLLLLYEGPKKPLFPTDALPEAVRPAARAHPERGGCWIVYRGPARGGVALTARAVRLDAEHSESVVEAKKAISNALSDAKKERFERIVVPLSSEGSRLAPAVHEGALLGGYSFDRYLKKKTRLPPVLLVVPGSALAELRRELADRALIARYVNAARDLLNEPPNVIRPETLARELRRLGRAAGLRVAIWDRARLEKERCGGILCVGTGSTSGPYLAIGEYAPRGAQRHLALVGKGVTFDSGGYGLKPADSQVGMKYDMAGAASAFCAACAIAALRLPIRVTVFAPLVENVISPEACLTTAIVRTRSGRTVEVRHTDAEGRLILADALTLACERKPDWVVDLATLTGACVVALGEDIAGVFGTSRDLVRRLVEAGKREGELFWELPLYMPYEEQLKATVADCKNIGSRWGGSILGAVFLKAWVPDGTKWLHCDIAGPGCKEAGLEHLGKGGKGFGLKTLVALARELAGEAR